MLFIGWDFVWALMLVLELLYQRGSVKCSARDFREQSEAYFLFSRLFGSMCSVFFYGLNHGTHRIMRKTWKESADESLGTGYLVDDELPAAVALFPDVDSAEWAAPSLKAVSGDYRPAGRGHDGDISIETDLSILDVEPGD